ncbi:MAG: DUF1573 domain-containing protein [Bacteroidales bacterium]|nr:DUF1573 domain-containing protein [Bacteroidales bacterium]
MSYKLFILFPILVIYLSACKPVSTGDSAKVVKSGYPAIIEFDELERDFGKITEGEKVGWYFKYRNAGESDLLISNVITTCGCTVSEYSKKPLSPGGEEELQIIFDSSGRKGKEIKNVKIESNAQNNIVNLKLIFEVIN